MKRENHLLKRRKRSLFSFRSALLLMCVFSLSALCSCGKSDHKKEVEEPQNREVLSFSGFDWLIKSSDGNKVGPGPNYFSNAEDLVWVDNEGQLHLKVMKIDGRWTSSEVTLLDAKGYGTYYFQTNSKVGALDKNVVGAFFLYKDDAKEIDVEYSRWNKEENENTQFAIQPADRQGNKNRFNLDPKENQWTTFMEWREDKIHFSIYRGALTKPGAADDLVKEWTYTGNDNPSAKDDLAVKINLWLFQGNPPSNGEEAEMVIAKFGYLK